MKLIDLQEARYSAKSPLFLVKIGDFAWHHDEGHYIGILGQHNDELIVFDANDVSDREIPYGLDDPEDEYSRGYHDATAIGTRRGIQEFIEESNRRPHYLEWGEDVKLQSVEPITSEQAIQKYQDSVRGQSHNDFYHRKHNEFMTFIKKFSE